MSRIRAFLVSGVVAAALAVPCVAQPSTNTSIAVLGGVGGSPDSESYTGSHLQALVSFEWKRNTAAQFRVGSLEIDLPTSFDTIFQPADMTYVSVATEYRTSADYYESGFIIGFGYYNLQSDLLVVPGQAVFFETDEDSFGLHIGSSGDFSLTQRWSVLVEVMGHYADFDAEQLFLTAQAGIRFRF